METEYNQRVKEKIIEKITGLLLSGENHYVRVCWGIEEVMKLKSQNKPISLHATNDVAAALNATGKFVATKLEGGKDYGVTIDVQYLKRETDKEIAELTKKNLDLQNKQLKFKALTFVLGAMVTLGGVFLDHILAEDKQPNTPISVTPTGNQGVIHDTIYLSDSLLKKK